MKFEKLTDEERKFAEENHALIEKFISERHAGRDYSDVYTIVCEAYLYAVQNYLRREELQKYKFSTIAYKCMTHRYYREKQQEELDKYKANVCACSLNTEVTSEENPVGNKQKKAYIDIVSDNYDFTDRIISDTYVEWLWGKFDKLFTENALNVLRMRMDGMTLAQIAEMKGCTTQAVNNTMKNLRKTAQWLVV